MSPMEQLAKQEYERGYSDGKSDYFAAGVAEGEMRAMQRMIANRVVSMSNQHPFAASGKPIDHIAEADKMVGCAYCNNPLFAGTKCNNCGRVTLAEPVKQEPVGYFLPPIDESDVWEEAINQDCPTAVPLYREPVSAEAIRAEALEEAEEIAKTIGGSFAVEFLAAIRGLK